MQSLWSGYGDLWRVGLIGGEAESVVVKRVVPPRGGRGDRSHARKLRSYAVEVAFYRQHAARTDDSCRVPRAFFADRGEGGWTLVLEDLDTSGFAGRRGRASEADIDAGLDWLAAFHAVFMGVMPDGLWRTGTYWHLDTRPDELAAMPNRTLARAARAIDQRLASTQFSTLVHGDAKIENICFGDGEVAVVDFQYVGGGSGVKDVVYYLDSCFDTGRSDVSVDVHIDRYFAALRRHLERRELNVDIDAVVADWRELVPFAWADFYRFLDGWAPGGYGVPVHAAAMIEDVLREVRA